MPICFTNSYKRDVREIITTVHIMPHMPFSAPQKLYRDWKALWDTGATHSVITQSTALNIGLKPVRFGSIVSVHGKTEDTPGYLVDISLGGFEIQKQLVWESKSDDANWDIIIGMDIISLGDFALSHSETKTFFSFRIPSLGKIDFAKEARFKKTKSKKSNSL